MLDDDHDAEMLKRFRVACATQRLPPDVADWLSDLLDELAPAMRRRARDQALRQAAALVGGGPWRQARALEAALAGEDAPGLTDRVRSLVAEAEYLAPCPRTARRLLRLAA